MIEILDDPLLRLMVQSEVETALTIFWLLNCPIANSLVAYGSCIDPYLAEYSRGNTDLQNTAVVVKWLEMLNLKCHVLSYLSNSKLIKPLLLTTKKDDDGLEIEISVDEAAQEYGWGPIDIAIEAFGLANESALKRDIIIADAEIKFGYDSSGDLILAGGILTYRDTNNHQVLDYSEVLQRLTGVYID